MSVMEELKQRYIQQEIQILEALLNQAKLTTFQKQLLFDGKRHQRPFHLIARQVLGLSDLANYEKAMLRDANACRIEIEKIETGRVK